MAESTLMTFVRSRSLSGPLNLDDPDLLASYLRQYSLPPQPHTPTLLHEAVRRGWDGAVDLMLRVGTCKSGTLDDLHDLASDVGLSMREAIHHHVALRNRKAMSTSHSETKRSTRDGDLFVSSAIDPARELSIHEDYMSWTPPTRIRQLLNLLDDLSRRERVHQGDLLDATEERTGGSKTDLIMGWAKRSSKKVNSFNS
jgi:hypothetical protein